MNHLGQNSEGDFDQLSLAGVDFGEDYHEDYGIVPTNLEGESTMYGSDFDQMGERVYGMGVMPEGLSGDFQQMGIVPSGLGGQYNQMGEIPVGLGGQYNQMGEIPSGLGNSYNQLGGQYNQMGSVMDTLKKPLFSVAGFGVTPIVLVGVAAALYFAKTQGMLRKFGI